MGTTMRRSAGRAPQERLAKLLNEQDAILRSRRQMLQSGRPSETSGVIDDEEHSVNAAEQGLGFSVLELTSRTVQGIETALQRLEAGVLGTCTDCHQKISAVRLRALPFAARCLGCQQRHDLAAAAGTD
jgi:DnaK suppressor protein